MYATMTPITIGDVRGIISRESEVLINVLYALSADEEDTAGSTLALGDIIWLAGKNDSLLELHDAIRARHREPSSPATPFLKMLLESAGRGVFLPKHFAVLDKDTDMKEHAVKRLHDRLVLLAQAAVWVVAAIHLRGNREDVANEHMSLALRTLGLDAEMPSALSVSGGLMRLEA